MQIFAGISWQELVLVFVFIAMAIWYIQKTWQTRRKKTELDGFATEKVTIWSRITKKSKTVLSWMASRCKWCVRVSSFVRRRIHVARVLFARRFSLAKRRYSPIASRHWKTARGKTWKFLTDKVYGSFLGFYTTLFLIAVIFRQEGAWAIGWPMIVVVLAICHLALSVREINERSQGVRIFFGYVFKQSLTSGPQFVPFPIRLRIFPKTTIKVDWGTKRPEDEPLIEQAAGSESWYIRGEPRRVTWADYKIMIPRLSADELRLFESEPLAGTVITDPRGFFNMGIHDPERFIAEVGSIEEAIDRVIDTCLAVLQEEAGKTCLALAVGRIEEFSERMKTRVEFLIGDPNAMPINGKPVPRSWGVDITGLHLKDFGTAYDTNKALVKRTKDIAEADGQATAVSRTSEGERDRIINVAQGNAAATISAAEAKEIQLASEGRGRAAASQAEGEAEAHVLDLLGKAAATEGGRVIMQTRAWEAGLKEGKVVLVSSDMSAIASTLLAGKSVLEAVTQPPRPSAKP